jgi:alpha-ribazole phosphatase
MRAVLIRHPTPLIGPGVCYGRLDIAVAPEEIARLAADPALPGAKIVWSSPAIRCLRLAEAIAATLAVPLRVDHRIWEVDFGTWEGQEWSAIDRDALDRWAADPLNVAPPGGETGAALIARVQNFRAEMQQDCVVVSHGGPLKVLLALLRHTEVDLHAHPPAIGSVTIVTLPAEPAQPRPCETT